MRSHVHTHTHDSHRTRFCSFPTGRDRRRRSSTGPTRFHRIEPALYDHLNPTVRPIEWRTRLGEKWTSCSRSVPASLKEAIRKESRCTQAHTASNRKPTAHPAHTCITPALSCPLLYRHYLTDGFLCHVPKIIHDACFELANGALNTHTRTREPSNRASLVRMG